VLGQDLRWQDAVVEAKPMTMTDLAETATGRPMQGT
jgi:hypothetical protein